MLVGLSRKSTLGPHPRRSRRARRHRCGVGRRRGRRLRSRRGAVPRRTTSARTSRRSQRRRPSNAERSHEDRAARDRPARLPRRARGGATSWASGSSSTSSSSSRSRRRGERPDRGRGRLPPGRRPRQRGLGRPRLPPARGLRDSARRGAARGASGRRAVRVRVRKPEVVLEPPVEYAAVSVERRAVGGRVACLRRARSEPRRPSRDTEPRARRLRGAAGGRARPGFVLPRDRSRRLPRPAAIPERRCRDRDVARTARAPRHLLEVERELGRVREGPRFGPRTIDLDLLLVDEVTMDEPGLDAAASAPARAGVRARAARRARPGARRPGRGPVPDLLEHAKLDSDP